MKLNIKFRELEKLVTDMGATHIDWNSNVKVKRIKTDWQVTLETKGIEFKNINDLKISSDGFLVYEGQQVLLYIKDAYVGRPYTFHFCDCNALKEMKEKGRINRYIATQRKDGFFLMDRTDYGTRRVITKNKEESLKACGSCLRWYSEHYPRNDKRWHTKENFNIKDFFETFKSTPISEMPMYNDITAPASGYTKDWKKISYHFKVKYHWTCQQCHIDLKNHRKLLHTHHISGVKSDNSEKNLTVLCVKCHSQQPSHERMKKDCSSEILEVENIYFSNDNVPF